VSSELYAVPFEAGDGRSPDEGMANPAYVTGPGAVPPELYAVPPDTGDGRSANVLINATYSAAPTTNDTNRVAQATYGDIQPLGRKPMAHHKGTDVFSGADADSTRVAHGDTHTLRKRPPTHHTDSSLQLYAVPREIDNGSDVLVNSTHAYTPPESYAVPLENGDSSNANEGNVLVHSTHDVGVNGYHIHDADTQVGDAAGATYSMLLDGGETNI
jgi:hypothetical protein